MFNLVINTRPAGKQAIEILNREIESGSDAVAKIELRGKTIYIFTKNYLEEK